MTGWITLGGARHGASPALPGEGPATLVLEFALPLDAPAVLFQAQGGGAALSVFAGPREGVAVLLREGPHSSRHRLPAGDGLPGWGAARLSLTATPGAGWEMVLEVPGSGWRRQTRGRATLALPLVALAAAAPAAAASTATARLAAIPAGQPPLRHPALLWAGIAAGPCAPAPLPWIGPATPVETPGGPRPAATLAPGDAVATLAGPRRVAAAGRWLTPASGSLTPVRLRAPWFAERCDLIVGPLQPVMLSGVAVDYLFGEDRVLALAADLAGAQAARSEPHAGAVEGVVLTLEHGDEPGAGVVLAGGCALALTDGPGAGARLIAPWEAVPLRPHLGPGLRARVA